MTTVIYAEHLANIRTLSIQVALSSPSDSRTTASVSADGSALTVSHQGLTDRITLPVNLRGSIYDGQLRFSEIPSSDVGFRIQLRKSSEEGGSSDRNAFQETNNVPWTASSLNADSEIACGGCKTIIVQRGRIKLWKDLPSENWAEMMDFWHCHRPDVPHDHEHKTPRKGYNADSTLAVSTGVGMADPTSLLCMPEDCQDLESTPTTTSRDPGRKIKCRVCFQQIGHVDQSTGGNRLRKIHLALSAESSAPAKSYPADKWLACLLLSSSESQGVRKLHVSRLDEKQEALRVWMFAPDLWVSTSASPIQPMRTTKILWQRAIPVANDTGSLNRQALSEAEIEIPDDEFLTLKALLSEGTRFVPLNARKFQEWNVALLPRFAPGDIDP